MITWFLKMRTGHMEGQPAAAGDNFTDAAIGSWYYHGVNWVADQKIVSGVTAETLAPRGTASRALAAAILMRFRTGIEALIAFEEKDVDDFEDYTVINFDHSKDTNFAVINEDAVVDDENLSTNRLVSYDESTGTYVFSNIDDSLKGLKPGDVFFSVYGSGEDDYILLKAGSIEVSGSTASITGADGSKFVTSSGEDVVVQLDNCKNVSISKLYMGHGLPSEYPCLVGVVVYLP